MGCDLLVQRLGQQIDIVLVRLGLLPILQQIQLSQNLVGERARHDERRMTSRTTQIQQPSCGQDNDSMPIWEYKPVHLGLDVLYLDSSETLLACHVDLVVKMANVADNGVVLHFLHVLQLDDVVIACGGGEDVDLANDRLHGDHLESMHACNAQIGSISVTKTRAPPPLMANAQPLPTSPYPHTSARLPPIITSVARMMPSGRECRHPYTLSNLDFVTQSFTLMAGKSSSPFLAISFRRCTPVVVSSETPLHFLAMREYFVLSTWMESFSNCKMHLNSALSVLAGSGSEPSFANFSSSSLPLWMSKVASPPSSTSWSHPSSPGTVIICSVHHQYSASVSPFQAYTVEVPALAMAAAAWSCVLKMLQEHHLTFAPKAAKVSISTPVWIVM